MTKTILITGSEGMLSTDLATASTSAGYKVIGLSHQQLDVTNLGQMRNALNHIKPDVVAYTPGIGVDPCETQSELGYHLHTWAAGLVARQCELLGSTLIYISSCGLFGDEVKFYSEYDPVELKTKYAHSKFLGERASLEACEKTFVIRPGWLFGGSPKHQRNFVFQRFLEAQRVPVIRSASDKFGCPTWTYDLSKKIMDLLETEQYGLYHVTNEGMATRYEYVKCIIDAFGLNNAVEPVKSSEYPRPAPVPDCEALENLNLKFLGISPMKPWQDAIHRYVGSLKTAAN